MFAEIVKHMNLKDSRRNDRLEKMLGDFSDRLGASIPEACQSLAATKGAYRFLNSDAVEAREIRKGFNKATIEQMQKNSDGKTFLFASDATNLVYTSHKKLKGIGVLRNQNARGLNLHTTLVLTESEVVLGVVNQVCWGRRVEDYGQRALRSKKPIEEKESYRWIESFKAANDALPDDARGIFIGDRGADLYELFLERRKKNMHLLVRAMHNRKLEDRDEKMFEDLANSPCAGITEVTIKRSRDREERVAKLEIRYKNVSISSPKNKPHLASINFTIVSAKEILSEENIKDPISWNLITTLPIDSLEKAIYAVRTYAKRWLIERFHYILKEGCRVEQLELEETDRIDKAVAIYTIVSCKLMHMIYLSRVAPDLPCTHIFDDDEWRALYCYAKKTAIAPKTPPTIQEAILMVAKIGGFLGRKRDGKPGVKVIWRGLAVLEGAVAMYKILTGKRCG